MDLVIQSCKIVEIGQITFLVLIFVTMDLPEMFQLYEAASHQVTLLGKFSFRPDFILLVDLQTLLLKFSVK